MLVCLIDMCYFRNKIAEDWSGANLLSYFSTEGSQMENLHIDLNAVLVF